MMKPVFKALLLIATPFLLVSCSAQKKFANRLRGAWQITKYDVNDTRVSAREFTNLGMITFNKNHTGTVDMKNIFTGSSSSGPRPFEWSNTENSVTIRGDNSEITKAWIVVTNKKKVQLWKSTDGYNRIQEIELRR
ncbi:MAG: lipocalin family protein [Lewinellaceae bacterium]|nr:lipocalin family protein [Lewinellaceae bacterium]